MVAHHPRKSAGMPPGPARKGVVSMGMPVRLSRNPALVVYWSARTLSFAGTGITVVVLPVLVYRLTGSPAAVAALTAVQAAPYLVFGLLAGAMADRLNRKKMMVACDAAAAVLLAAVPAAAALHQLAVAQLFLVALGIGTAFVWFDAANFGTVPALAGRGQLPAAISLIEAPATTALLLGPALGGALLAVMAPALCPRLRRELPGIRLAAGV